MFQRERNRAIRRARTTSNKFYKKFSTDSDSEPERQTNNYKNNMPDQPQLLTLEIDPLKYIERLPEFDGKGNDLINFLDLVELIIPSVIKYDISSQNILLSRIKSKLVNKARVVIEVNNNAKTWSEIREVLINNFGEKKSALQIYNELRDVTFTSNSVDLYNNIKNILRRLNNKIREEPNSSFSIAANIKTGLEIFKDKLPEPMRSVLFSRNPETIEVAMDILHEGNYAYFNPFGNNSKNKNNSNNNSRFNYGNNKNNSKINQNQYRNNANYNKSNSANYNNFNRNNNYNRNYNSNNSYNQNTNRTNNNNHNSNNYNDNNSRANYNNFNNSRSNSQNTRRNATNSQSEPMDVVPPSINSRVNTVQTVENFQLTASTKSPFLI